MTASRAATAAVTPTPLDDDPSVRYVFTDRNHGTLSETVGTTSAAGARRHLRGGLGVDEDAAVFMEQVHGSRVALIDPADLRGPAPVVAHADGIVTTAEHTALVVLVADCVPLLLAVPGRAVGAVHAGRRGVAGGIVGVAVETLLGAADATAGDVVAVVGPAIGGCCYELPDAVADEVLAVAPTAGATTRWGTRSVDLPSAVVSHLRAAGVRRVTRDGGCTACDAERWFSHRASEAGRWPPGRQAGAIVRVAGQRDLPSLH